MLEEPNSEEQDIFNRQPQHSQVAWAMETEDTHTEDAQHYHSNRGKSKAAGKVQSDAAFSSPLVRRKLSQIFNSEVLEL